MKSAKILHFILFDPVDLTCIQKSPFNFFFSVQIPGFSPLPSDRTLGLAFFLLIMRALAVTSLFLSDRSYPSLIFLLPLSPLQPYSEHVGVYTVYLRSHFSVSQPKTLGSKATRYLSKLRQTTCLEQSHSSFCFFFSSTKFLAAATNLSSPIAIFPDEVAYPILKHLPYSGINFLKIFNLSWSFIPILPSGKHLLIFLSIRWESLLTLLLPSGLSH